MQAEDLVLLPFVRARRALAGRELRLHVLVPPYACAGVGTLRLLRVTPAVGAGDGAWDVIAGYDGYERLS